MTARRWMAVAVVGLVLFLGFVVAHAMLSTDWHGSLATPPAQPAQSVVYHCGPSWGSASVRGPATTNYPVVGKPCDTRRQDQVVTIIDIILAVAGIAVVVGWGRERYGARIAL